ncbi:uncharacterized protein LACBIDRAFT_333319 [Laccaria bicolor S238N-H82]|uniref:Predicted protein n=1 Tax=Laccaria bicolor (strain S238N-H82 / ATCC MYA-4686) TaxID=486041 RepID=B0DVJ9_LACBS|nr:uncharacterized protein LACBIDRAFT_333319 [Laccaria bicolor S238N-H82]EDR01430.1 predicted protein [Laccaria bicolor S238N-H82]|eukprot:XP_001887975.1 predicted protein [Laccaria bicolor S238N-H82]
MSILGPEETRGIRYHIFEISVMLSFMIHQEGVLYLLSFKGPEETRVSFKGPEETRVSFKGPEETRVSFEGPEETRGSRVRVLELCPIFCFGSKYPSTLPSPTCSDQSIYNQNGSALI